MYTIFTRTWWKENPDWPDGLEPCPGSKRKVTAVETEKEAREMCRRSNRDRTTSQVRLGFKYEYTRSALWG